MRSHSQQQLNVTLITRLRPFSPDVFLLTYIWRQLETCGCNITEKKRKILLLKYSLLWLSRFFMTQVYRTFKYRHFMRENYQRYAKRTGTY